MHIIIIMPYSLGIDLGTSNCCIAFCDQTNHSQVIYVQGKQLLESVVDFYDPKNIKVGIGARTNNKGFEKGTVVRNNKRVLGRKFDDNKIKGFKEYCEAKVVEDADGFCAYDIPGMGGKVSTEDVAVELLKVLYETAVKKDLGKIEKVCITIPATYTQKQKSITRHAANKVIKNIPIEFISEPSAAAIHYSLSTSIKNGNVLIYDLGGGTFDVSIIRITNGNQYEILGTSGHPTIGGCLFDKYLLELARQKYKKQFDDEDDEDLLPEEKENINVYTSALHKLLDICREKKEELSTPGVDRVEIDMSEYFTYLNEERKRHGCSDYDADDDDDEPAIEECIEIEITRDDFERLITQDIKTTIDLTKECIETCGLSKNEIEHVLLVGGSSHLPKVKKLLREEFGEKKIGADINADTCVACGAALRGQDDFAGFEEINKLVFTERSTFAIAVEKGRNHYQELIPANSKLPYSGYKDYKLHECNPGFFISSVYEKSGAGNKEYELIKNIVVEDESFYDRAARIRVEYKLTKEGELTVSFIDLDDNRMLRKEEQRVLD